MQFWSHFEEALQAGTFVKLTMSKPVRKQEDWRNVFARHIELKGAPHLSCVLRYERRDDTHNFPVEEGTRQLQSWLEHDFYNADLFTLEDHWTLQFSKKRRPHLRKGKAQHEVVPEALHDQRKMRPLESAGKPYLTALGITTQEGNVRRAGQRKFRQINKYIEIIGHLLEAADLPADARIVDMGSGKGYLTFALYDYLRHQRELPVTVTGVELRPELVDNSNQLAKASGFEHLHFVSGDIQSYLAAEGIDMLIALHACDTATDDAIAKGIRAGAEVIVVAPCCQKQVRKDTELPEHLQPLLRHGILLERQSELLTDGMRALLLEAHGYRTKVFEFIATEHTSKNVMITATRAEPRLAALEELQQLKERFGVQRHYLEELLSNR